MTSICIVRHGETDWNAAGRLQGTTDIHLNKTGVAQAQECGQFLSSGNWDVMITSPLQRARKTAEIINEDLYLPFVVMEEFSERYFGDAEGMTKEDRVAAFPDKKYPNQEIEETFHRRIMNGLQKINHHYGDQKILLVAHGAVIGAILSILSNGEIGSRKTRLINAGMSHIGFTEGRWCIREYNQVTHLSQYSEKGRV
ncbi:histidine phosphatase family protein [Jeotgalibacillus haloalkalitolerans]|uniref:Histidine phosphatase family protein n=1 Tax=Jeotgalibacillus haloalkalitolerans TaxID=3104292 RepID=A0ABU5KNB9_9BACL|nr:histidine phosphatase family protein [Jeotgalibacillus sp. HH7-29]MDZ5712649.1 histidine phosphatase family protein [Jeotgalibacillus sp. HH7-29]